MPQNFKLLFRGQVPRRPVGSLGQLHLQGAFNVAAAIGPRQQHPEVAQHVLLADDAEARLGKVPGIVLQVGVAQLLEVLAMEPGQVPAEVFARDEGRVGQAILLGFQPGGHVVLEKEDVAPVAGPGLGIEGFFLDLVADQAQGAAGVLVGGEALALLVVGYAQASALVDDLQLGTAGLVAPAGADQAIGLLRILAALAAGRALLAGYDPTAHAQAPGLRRERLVLRGKQIAQPRLTLGWAR